MKLLRHVTLIVVILAPNICYPDYPLGQTEGVDWQLDGSLRVRHEFEDWSGQSNNSTNGDFGHVKTQFGIRAKHKHFTGYVQGQIFQLYGLDSNISGGPDLNYYSTNNSESSPGSFSLRQGWITLRDDSSAPLELTVGRFLYSSGLEVSPEGYELTWIKKQRISQRMIGPFDFTGGRSFDGARIDWGKQKETGRVTGFLSHPTQGGFETNNGQTIHEITVSSAVWSLPVNYETRDAQIFAYNYFDRRDVTKPDNRPLDVRQADRESINITTVGGHFVNLHELDQSTVLDTVLWGAYQRGDWGTLVQSAYAFDAELGVRLKEVPWKPWIRAGYTYASGDGDSSDGKNNTFFRMVPTLRIYAMTPAYAQQNLQEVFAQVIAQPSKSVSIRSSLHLLHLAEGGDLQYTGSGAAERATRFGVGGNNLQGATEIGQLLDIEVTYEFSQYLSATCYLGHLVGGRGTDKLVGPGGDSDVTYSFLEASLKL